MATDKYGELPPRPPLSVPFPLRLGDDFHLGGTEAVEEASQSAAPPAPAPARESPSERGLERGG
jgi:hypothetical protein